jgi:predicted dehydrogenase
LFKICIIGCGWVADFGHGPAYRKYAGENSGVELTACCDVNENRSFRYKNKFGFQRHYTDHRSMIKNEEPDAICLNIPDSQTASICTEILEQGIPVLLEKPIGVNLKETYTLNCVAKKTGTPNMVAFNRRFMPLVQLYKKTIDEKIGNAQITSVEYYLSRFKRTESNFEITAIHGIDTVRYITGSDYRSVQFTYKKYPEYGQNVMDIHLYGEMDNRITAILNFYPVCGAVVERMVVNTFENSFLIEIPVWDSIDIPGRITIVSNNEIISELSLHDNRQNSEEFQRYGFYGEDAAFFDCIRRDNNPSPTIGDSIPTAEIMEFIRKKKAHYISDR